MGGQSSPEIVKKSGMKKPTDTSESIDSESLSTQRISTRASVAAEDAAKRPTTRSASKPWGRPGHQSPILTTIGKKGNTSTQKKTPEKFPDASSKNRLQEQAGMRRRRKSPLSQSKNSLKAGDDEGGLHLRNRRFSQKSTTSQRSPLVTDSGDEEFLGGNLRFAPKRKKDADGNLQPNSRRPSKKAKKATENTPTKAHKSPSTSDPKKTTGGTAQGSPAFYTRASSKLGVEEGSKQQKAESERIPSRRRSSPRIQLQLQQQHSESEAGGGGTRGGDAAKQQRRALSRLGQKAAVADVPLVPSHQYETSYREHMKLFASTVTALNAAVKLRGKSLHPRLTSPPPRHETEKAMTTTTTGFNDREEEKQEGEKTAGFDEREVAAEMERDRGSSAALMDQTTVEPEAYRPITLSQLPSLMRQKTFDPDVILSEEIEDSPMPEDSLEPRQLLPRSTVDSDVIREEQHEGPDAMNTITTETSSSAKAAPASHPELDKGRDLFDDAMARSFQATADEEVVGEEEDAAEQEEEDGTKGERSRGGALFIDNMADDVDASTGEGEEAAEREDEDEDHGEGDSGEEVDDNNMVDDVDADDGESEDTAEREDEDGGGGDEDLDDDGEDLKEEEVVCWLASLEAPGRDSHFCDRFLSIFDDMGAFELQDLAKFNANDRDRVFKGLTAIGAKDYEISLILFNLFECATGHDVDKDTEAKDLGISVEHAELVTSAGVVRMCGPSGGGDSQEEDSVEIGGDGVDEDRAHDQDTNHTSVPVLPQSSSEDVGGKSVRRPTSPRSPPVKRKAARFSMLEVPAAPVVFDRTKEGGIAPVPGSPMHIAPPASKRVRRLLPSTSSADEGNHDVSMEVEDNDSTATAICPSIATLTPFVFVPPVWKSGKDEAAKDDSGVIPSISNSGAIAPTEPPAEITRLVNGIRVSQPTRAEWQEYRAAKKEIETQMFQEKASNSSQKATDGDDDGAAVVVDQLRHILDRPSARLLSLEQFHKLKSVLFQRCESTAKSDEVWAGLADEDDVPLPPNGLTRQISNPLMEREEPLPPFTVSRFPFFFCPGTSLCLVVPVL
jgi:hypothetical protein